MTGHTAKGVPYALPTDALIDYPTASLELANKIGDLPWTDIPDNGFASANWRSYNQSNFKCSFAKDARGVVYMRGLAQWLQGVTPAGQSIWSIPAAYRPAAGISHVLTTWVALDAGPRGPARVDVNSSGTLILSAFNMLNDPGGAGYSSMWVSLSPLTWPTT